MTSDTCVPDTTSRWMVPESRNAAEIRSESSASADCSSPRRKLLASSAPVGESVARLRSSTAPRTCAARRLHPGRGSFPSTRSPAGRGSAIQWTPRRSQRNRSSNPPGLVCGSGRRSRPLTSRSVPGSAGISPIRTPTRPRSGSHPCSVSRSLTSSTVHPAVGGSSTTPVRVIAAPSRR